MPKARERRAKGSGSAVGRGLRIVAGELAGRRFGRTVGEGTRPTADRAREAIASALDARGAIAGARVLELFAGTGALSFEVLSRGATRAVLVESDASAARAIDESARELGLEARARVLSLALGRGSLLPVAREGPFDLVIADPPYDAAGGVAAILDELVSAGALADEAWLVLEHRRGDRPGTGPFATISDYRYGDTEVILARRPPSEGGPMEQS